MNAELSAMINEHRSLIVRTRNDALRHADYDDVEFYTKIIASIDALVAAVERLQQERDAANVSCKAALRDAANLRQENAELRRQLQNVRTELRETNDRGKASRVLLDETQVALNAAHDELRELRRQP